MKTKNLLTLFSIIAIIFSSCADGDKGVSSFQVTCASGFLTSFATTDSNIPSGFSLNTSYPTKAGVYGYSYDYGVTNYAGTYEIIQEAGESWNGISDGFLTQPASGKNRDYTFDCDAASGSELSYKNMLLDHKDIFIDKTIYFNGGKLRIKGKGIYDPKHLLHSNKNMLITK